MKERQWLADDSRSGQQGTGAMIGISSGRPKPFGRSPARPIPEKDRETGIAAGNLHALRFPDRTPR
jgi:hypothetical protein